MFAKTFILVTMGALASAQTFVGFPNSLTCKTAGGTATLSKTEVQNGIVGPKGLKIDDSAANVASGDCSTLSKIPLFSQTVDGKGDVSFAFDKSTNTYHFCSADGAIDASGFQSSCTEN
ncbi:hypothetical protein LX32DRAFT_656427 [Colletotrichum zoysiae]|uniref:Uncharacterized protein n=1 Tax=Colletotrichum zoysiae TaxID=1216348 RepID=A0AAD9HA04_9PEZI|nr:hypothetical protein LX32DRAFT_656427 [Colletotrichum zoysiae]